MSHFNKGLQTFTDTYLENAYRELANKLNTK